MLPLLQRFAGRSRAARCGGEEKDEFFHFHCSSIVCLVLSGGERDRRLGHLVDAVFADVLARGDGEELVAAHHVHLRLAVLGELAEVLEGKRRCARLLRARRLPRERGSGCAGRANGSVCGSAALAALELLEANAAVGLRRSGPRLDQLEHRPLAAGDDAGDQDHRGRDDGEALLGHDFTMCRGDAFPP